MQKLQRMENLPSNKFVFQLKFPNEKGKNLLQYGRKPLPYDIKHGQLTPKS